MKRLIIWMVMLAVGAGYVSADEYRDFLSADGKAIRGKVLRYDAKKKMVTIMRDNRNTATVPLRAFSDKDQDYVLEWEFNKVFLSDSSFKIEAKRKKVKNGSDNSNSSSKNENTAYEITLQNRSTSTLEKLGLEYCIYYEQEKSGSKTITEEGVRFGKMDVASMRPKSEKELMTDPVTIYTHELNADWIYTDGRDNKITGRVRGIWVRVKMKTKSGKMVTRDFTMPDSLSNSMSWKKSSKHVGRNK